MEWFPVVFVTVNGSVYSLLEISSWKCTEHVTRKIYRTTPQRAMMHIAAPWQFAVNIHRAVLYPHATDNLTKKRGEGKRGRNFTVFYHQLFEKFCGLLQYFLLLLLMVNRFLLTLPYLKFRD